MTKQITFLGGGNMAKAIVAGLIGQQYPTEAITVCDRNQSKRKLLNDEYGVLVEEDILTAVKDADVIVLAVKPDGIQAVSELIKETVNNNRALVLSVAAGIKMASYETWFGKETAIIRTMPNTPSQLGVGATGLFANQATTDKERQLADNLMRSVGITSWTNEEATLEAIMTVSGCGPAYFFFITEHISRIATTLGLDKDEAEKLAVQTMLGAASMAEGTDDDLATLRRQVCSPGGATEQAIKVFEQQGMDTLLEKAMLAAKDRAEELA